MKKHSPKIDKSTNNSKHRDETIDKTIEQEIYRNEVNTKG